MKLRDFLLGPVDITASENGSSAIAKDAYVFSLYANISEGTSLPSIYTEISSGF